jgi:hypothetical protein
MTKLTLIEMQVTSLSTELDSTRQDVQNNSNSVDILSSFVLDVKHNFSNVETAVNIPKEEFDQLKNEFDDVGTSSLRADLTTTQQRNGHVPSANGLLFRDEMQRVLSLLSHNP